MLTTTSIADLIDHAHTLSLEIVRYRGHDVRAIHAMETELSDTWAKVDALRELRDLAR